MKDELKDPLIYIDDINKGVKRIKSFIKNITKDQFASEGLEYNATLRQLEIIGEAAKNLPEWYKKEHPEIPWHKMIAVRNILIHEYSNVNDDLIWNIVISDLPALTDDLKKLEEGLYARPGTE